MFFGDRATQQGLITYGLPSILSIFPTQWVPLLAAVYEKSIEIASKFRREEEDPVDTAVPSTQTLRAIMSVLKTARKGGLIEGPTLEACLSGIPSYTALPESLRSCAQLLRISISADDEDLRCDVLEYLALGKKTAEPPTLFELGIPLAHSPTQLCGYHLLTSKNVDMVKFFLQVNIKCASASLRNNIAPWLGKFLCRIRAYRPPPKKASPEEVEESKR